MDQKALRTLELPRVLERLARHASFSAGVERALACQPAKTIQEANRLLEETDQARALLLRHYGLGLSDAHDIRPSAEDAVRGMTLPAPALLQIRGTLQAARSLFRGLSRQAELAPEIARVAGRIPEIQGLIETISRTINEEGEVQDSASERLGNLRSAMRTSLDRLLTRLQRVIAEHAGDLQEAIITQRDGRYVVPLRAECKGRLRGIVHDQSSSGATLFVEPLTTVELGNRWRESSLAEQEEVRRILAELSQLVGAARDPIHATVETLADIDFAFARARYAEELQAERPTLVEFADTAPQDFSPLALFAARHPLLDPEKVVAVDIALRPGIKALVITGPNTGGKTVSLKTAGLLALMAQCGMFLPTATGSHVAFFDSIFADIGDEQSIEQSLSTFSAHIAQIVRILAASTDRSLVLFDELGSGTDPQEGSALARAILSELLRRGISALVATHYPELKAFAHNTPGTENASMEFDVSSLRPTYRLMLGLPGRSNALAIAQRLGLDPALLQEARSMVSTSDLEADRLLEKIQHEREAARNERADAEKLTHRARDKERALAMRLERIETERRAILEEARAAAREETETVLEELRELRRRAAGRVVQNAETAGLVEEARALQRRLDEPVQAEEEAAPAAPRRDPKAGDRVRLRSLKLEGIVLVRQGDEYEVQVGALHVRANRADLSLPDESGAGPAAKPASTRLAKTMAQKPSRDPIRTAPGLEFDMRGMMVEDGLIELARFIDSAAVAGLPWVRIIHGKGTGRLRAAVRDALKAHSCVASIEGGSETEGGDGVTVARLHE
jgi:DNA mismatch repair protein MutS2